MAGYITQVGTHIYSVSRAGVATEITIPSTFTPLGTDQPCRTCLFQSPVGVNPAIIFVNGSAVDFFINSDLTVLPLAVAAPSVAVTTAVGASTGLTGAYQVVVTFKIKDPYGQTLYETPFGPASTSLTLANQSIALSSIPTSENPYVNCRSLYRTTTGGNTFYPWFELDDNVTLTEDRSGPDSRLVVNSGEAANFGTPPNFKLITSWGGRLWGVPRIQQDLVRWTEDQILYAWNPTNELLVPPAHSDSTGVVAFIPRRDQLGIARKDRLFQITGTDNDTFERLQISETIGCISQESVVIIRDVAYWLGERGVIEWSASSIGYVSEAQVDGWFTTDTYFNRSMFSEAQGRYNFDTDSYELLLASLGSDVLDTWISFDLKGRVWFGPHRTTAFNPTCVGNDGDFHGQLTDSNELPISVFGGSDGFLYKRDATNKNDHETSVAFDITFPPYHMGEPDLEKYWGEISVHTRKESSGTLIITPTVGNLDASPQTTGTSTDIEESTIATIEHDLTIPRERLRRIGYGKYLTLNLTHNEEDVGLRLHGIELPVNIVGRR